MVFTRRSNLYKLLLQIEDGPYLDKECGKMGVYDLLLQTEMISFLKLLSDAKLKY